MTNDLKQVLLKRHANYTSEQFSEHWVKHAAKVTPWALENGIKHYAQVCTNSLALINLFCSMQPWLSSAVTLI